MNQDFNQISSDNKMDSENGNLFKTHSSEQYQQLMTMLSNHLIYVKASDHHEGTSTSCMAGICHSVSPKSGISSMKFWMVDLGASQDICSNVNVFAFMRHVRNVTVGLPNGTCIPVSFSGDV